MRHAVVLFTFASIMSASAVLAAPKGTAKDPVQVQGTLSGTGSAAQETTAGDLLADALRETAGAQVGLVPADDIADTTINPGTVPAAQLATLLRHPNDPGDTIVVLKLTGAQLLKALELGVGHAPQPSAGFWQVSGVQVRYDPAQPEGKRILLAGASGSELSAAGTYTVAMTRSEALGDLGYFRVWGKKDIVQDTGVALSQSIAAYALAHKTIPPAGTARITAAQ